MNRFKTTKPSTAPRIRTFDTDGEFLQIATSSGSTYRVHVGPELVEHVNAHRNDKTVDLRAQVRDRFDLAWREQKAVLVVEGDLVIWRQGLQQRDSVVLYIPGEMPDLATVYRCNKDRVYVKGEFTHCRVILRDTGAVADDRKARIEPVSADFLQNWETTRKRHVLRQEILSFVSDRRQWGTAPVGNLEQMVALLHAPTEGSALHAR